MSDIGRHRASERLQYRLPTVQTVAVMIGALWTFQAAVFATVLTGPWSGTMWALTVILGAATALFLLRRPAGYAVEMWRARDTTQYWTE